MSDTFNPFGNTPYSPRSSGPAFDPKQPSRPGTITYAILELFRSGYVPINTRDEFNSIWMEVQNQSYQKASNMLFARAKEFEKQGNLNMANRWYMAAGNMCASAGYKGPAAQFFIRFYINAKKQGDRNARFKAEQSLVSVFPSNPDAALGIKDRPPRDPMAAKTLFAGGQEAIKTGNFETACGKFRDAAGYDFHHHGALFAYALCLCRIHFEKSKTSPDTPDKAKIVGPPLQALQAMDAATVKKASSGYLAESWDSFVREFADQQKDTAWAGGTPESPSASAWIMLGLMSDYLGNRQAAQECFGKAMEWMESLKEEGAILIRALNRLESPQQKIETPEKPQAVPDDAFFNSSNLYCHLFAGLAEIAIAMAVIVMFSGFGKAIGRPSSSWGVIRDFIMLLSFRTLLIIILRTKWLNWIPLFVIPYTIVFFLIWVSLKILIFFPIIGLLIYDIIKTSQRLKEATGVPFDKRALPVILGGECQAFVGLPFHASLIVAYLVLAFIT
jgi:tetratricopeptide (TPR) repeat protein